MPRKYRTRRSNRAKVTDNPVVSDIPEECTVVPLEQKVEPMVVVEKKRRKHKPKPKPVPFKVEPTPVPSEKKTPVDNPPVRKQRKPNKWIEHVRSTRANHPDKTYKQCMLLARENYKR